MSQTQWTNGQTMAALADLLARHLAFTEIKPPLKLHCRLKNRYGLLIRLCNW
jgi:hypothetical protein